MRDEKDIKTGDPEKAPRTEAGVGGNVLAAIASTEKTRLGKRREAPPPSPAQNGRAANGGSPREPSVPGYDNGGRRIPPEPRKTPPGPAEHPAETKKTPSAAAGSKEDTRTQDSRKKPDRNNTYARDNRTSSAHGFSNVNREIARMDAEIERLKLKEKERKEAARKSIEDAEKKEAERKAKKAERDAERERLDKIRREIADISRAERQRLREKYSSVAANAFKTAKEYSGYFVLFFVIVSVLLVSVAAGSLFIFGSHADNAGLAKEIVYTVGSRTVRKQKSAELIRGNTVYANLSELAEMCGMSVSGDMSSVKFSTSAGEYAVFGADSGVAVLNGSRAEMEGPAVIEKNAVLVPLSFIETKMTGICVEYSREHESETGDDGAPLPEGLITGIKITVASSEASGVPVGFVLKATEPLNSLSKDSIPSGWLLIGDDNIVYTYNTDLSSYQKYMNPSDKKKYYLIINADNRKDSSFIPDGMIPVLNVKSGKSFQMDKNAEKSLEAMFTEMASLGIRDVYVNRAYVSYATQKSSFDTAYYNERYYYKNNFASTGKYFSDTANAVLGKAYVTSNYVSKGIYHLSDADARRVASTYCAEPGTSDHQSGLSADIWGTDGSAGFAKTEAYQWLKENAYKFGFIERYPAGKEKVTGFSAEPYHWRFVGQYHAAVMHDYGFCLEEYVAYITDGRP
ncbi:MAG: D-alanyl-D-alanine carboxypeptidase family protein [Clostridia bacterium]|nr:D-alanyl-D-alanine carboxypeptidase family protein [Clostridia bacterium]